MKNPSFISFDWRNGELFRDTDSSYPCKLHGLVGKNTLLFQPGSTYFIYQYDGLSYINGVFPLLRGYYAVCNHKESVFINGDKDCKAIVIERVHFPIGKNIDSAAEIQGIQYSSPFMLGGPIEEKGRLKYIDGCTDSLLIAPWKKGEACLNHLHFPSAINQTPHTHPTIRIGLVAEGSGECITPFGNMPLTKGMIFAILPENGKTETGNDGNLHQVGTHSFRTTTGTMDVIAFHPDSDFGPEDENHPMINRTIVDGVSANQIEEIRTK